jgi:uncharacterized repeat protein (TIGR03943 family)
MSNRAYRTYQALILVALGLMLLSRVWEGSVLYSASAPYIAFSLAGGIGLLVLGEITFTRGRPVSGVTRPQHRSYGRLLWLALPVALVLVLPDLPLGSGGLPSRGVNLAVPQKSGRDPIASLSVHSNIYDWVGAYQKAGDPSQLDGQFADVIGFVAHVPGLTGNQFLLVRYVSSGSTSGALAYAMLVEWPSAANFSDDEWVEVRGPVGRGQFNQQSIPNISAVQVIPTVTPVQPYLSP